MHTIDQMIAQEVCYCVSGLVSTLAGGWTGGDIHYGFRPGNARDRYVAIDTLASRACELAAPIDDWEEAAIEAGWTHHAETSAKKECWRRLVSNDDGSPLRAGGIMAVELVANTFQEACVHDALEPHQREVYEHWIVSDWLADVLDARGEKVGRDFAGMTIWARTTTGQSITLDSVICDIYAATHQA